MIKIKTHVEYAGHAPACFERPEDYVEWKKFARLPGSTVNGRIKACIDCTPQFQREMIACGRCENPEVRFRRMTYKLNSDDCQWELQGYLPSIKEQLKNKEQQHV